MMRTLVLYVIGNHLPVAHSISEREWPPSGPLSVYSHPQATLTFGQCALRLIQVKAVGLVEVSNLMSQQLSAEVR